uniref:VQ domain-containing protein n=1 Tax=Globodera rostochiensis TaxID=31243 RepID=A0A914GSK5_GLORO
MRRPVIVLVLLAILGLFACCAGAPKEEKRKRAKLLPRPQSIFLNPNSTDFREVVQRHTGRESINFDQSHPGMSNVPQMISFDQSHHPNPNMSNMPTTWTNPADSANMLNFESQQYHPAGNTQWTNPAGNTQWTNTAGNTQSTNPGGRNFFYNPFKQKHPKH